MTKPVAPHLDLRHLRYFVALAEELHFGKAAARLGISQPPLSEQILGLEAQLGTRLFQRSKRSVALTSSGHVLYTEAINLLVHADRVRALMSSASGGNLGPLFLGCVPSALFGVLPNILQGWHSQPDGLDIRVTEAHTTEVVSAVMAGRLDAGLVWADRAAAPLSIRPLENVRIVAALHASHPLAKKKIIDLKDLAMEPLVMPPRTISPYQFDLTQGAFRRAGLEPRIGQTALSIAAQLSFVASKLGYGLMPEYAMKLGIQNVVFRQTSSRLGSAPMSFIWNDERPSPQLAAFRDYIFKAFPPAAKARAARPKAVKSKTPRRATVSPQRV